MWSSAGNELTSWLSAYAVLLYAVLVCVPDQSLFIYLTKIFEKSYGPTRHAVRLLTCSLLLPSVVRGPYTSRNLLSLTEA